MRCRREIGCHNCIIEQLEEDMRLFRAAIVQFLIEPSGHLENLKQQALSMKVQIDGYYESPKE